MGSLYSKLCSKSSTRQGGHAVLNNNTVGCEAPKDPRAATPPSSKSIMMATAAETGTSDFDSCDLHIRTLSTILHNMSQGDPPTRPREDVPSFLRYIATLLTRGVDDTKQTKQVVAVTGTIEESCLRTLVAVENSPNASRNGSEPFNLEIMPVERNSQTSEEIYKRIGTPQSIEEYIADLLGLFHSVNPDNLNGTDVIQFRTFITIHCINKLQSRLKAEKYRWCLPVSDVLNSWKPIEGDKVEPFWVTKPSWTVSFEIEDENMKTRPADNGGEEWEFSIETAHLWSWILAMLLENINDQITKYKNIDPKHRKWPLEHSGTCIVVETIISLYSALFILMIKYKRVVKALLAIPSLASSFLPAVKEPTNSITTADDQDEAGLLAPEPNESLADGVYRYLEGVVAWADALHQLLISRKDFTTILVDVVHVTGFRSDVMSADDVISGLLKRHPSANIFIQTTKPFLESRVPSFFYGAIHAEATLMGLISYSFHECNGLGYTKISNPGNFKENFQPYFQAWVNPAIAMGKKCCWCCEKLSQLIKPAVSVPGSHGTIYPWCPPRIGIGLDVLEALETHLWTRLYQGLIEQHYQSIRVRQSSRSSSIEDFESLSTNITKKVKMIHKKKLL